MYQGWSVNQGDYINNVDEQRKKELIYKRRKTIKRIITVVSVYLVALIVSFFIIRWI